MNSILYAEKNENMHGRPKFKLANRSYFGLVNIPKTKNINRKYKVIIYKILIKPVLMYGAETWVLIMADDLRLGVFERKY